MTTQGNQYRSTREFLLVYTALIPVARDRRLLYYREVAPLISVASQGHHMARQVGQVLGEFSEDEYRAGGPMLSAIAVSEAGVPGEGFFKLTRRLGKLSASGSAAEVDLLRTEQGLVYTTWAPSKTR